MKICVFRRFQVIVLETPEPAGSYFTINAYLLKARSLVNKFRLLQNLLCQQKPDLVFITETWLNSKLLVSEILGNLHVLFIDLTEALGKGVEYVAF